MLKWFNKNKEKKNKGFTLVELIIVVAILAILVGLLAPQYTKYVERSRQAADASNLDNLVTAVKVATADGAYDIKDDTYTFVITAAKTELTSGTTKNADEVKKALVEYAGTDWEKTTLKSSKWTHEKSEAAPANKPTETYIAATCKVDKDGAVTVNYYPSSVKNSVKEKKTQETQQTP